MSGFSLNTMQGLMMANTALTSAKANSSALSRMESRKQILESEIASGNGDTEGKKAEIEKIEAQAQKTAAMQQENLNAANSNIGASVTADADSKDESAAGKDKPSDTAKDKAGELQDKVKDETVAAVDYQPGMQIAEEGKTGVMVSPEFLEKMDGDASLDAEYTQNLGKMADLSAAQSASQIRSQNWSVDRTGSISHYLTVATGTSFQEMAAIRQISQDAGRQAFGDAFAGSVVTRQGTVKPQIQGAGLLIDTSL